LKITVLANRDIASNLALNHLLPRLAGHHSLRLFLSEAVGGTQQRPRELQELKFFEQTLFNQLLFPLLDQRGAAGRLCSFAQLGQYTEQAPATLNKINSPEGLATLEAAAPDLVLSIRYGGILREAAIAIPALGVINLHSGLLPHYRGVMATFRALLNGETRIGTTIHYIQDAGIDTGAIIATTTQPVTREHTYLWHVLQLYPDACDRLLECVATLAGGGTLDVTPQGGGGQYYSFPETADLDAFRRAGWSLYDPGEIAALAQQFIEV